MVARLPLTQKVVKVRWGFRDDERGRIVLLLMLMLIVLLVLLVLLLLIGSVVVVVHAGQ